MNTAQDGARDYPAKGCHPASAPSLREEALRAWEEYQRGLSRVVRGGGREGDHSKSEGGVGGGGDGEERSKRRQKDRGSYREYGGIGVLMLDVWANQGWRVDETGMASARDQDGPGFHPHPLLSKR